MTLSIPNKELMKEFQKALKDESFGYVSEIVENSKKMLKAIINGDTKTVENILHDIHTEALALLLDKNVVEGKHTLDDVQETVNSSYVFDTIIETLGEKIDHKFLKNIHESLMFNTSMHAKGYAGIYKVIPNMLIGTNAKIAQPFEVESKLDELLEWYYSLNKITLKELAEFHYRFELIHPFQDGNGRIGRFIMLKQMLEENLEVKIIS